MVSRQLASQPAAKETFKEMNHALNYDLLKIMNEGPNVSFCLNDDHYHVAHSPSRPKSSSLTMITNKSFRKN